ncbi:MAG: radical SAM protein [Verrucomicrobia bacterium]|jgi:7-carboxy-7-deazaguanine synthase|nr:radical SAM protein [Verrucomicrobiota bacterium]
MSRNLLVHEIYLSIQGESTFAGLPCIFIRLTGCDLRCSYCDTAYAFKGGQTMSIEAIIQTVENMAQPFARNGTLGHKLPLVELTGGEPLLQKESPALVSQLCDRGYTVLIETSGAHDIRKLDPRSHRIMDLKCPSSGESDRMFAENIEHLSPRDEVKFVISTHEDYRWCKSQIEKWQLNERCEILVSWCAPLTASQQDPNLKPAPSPETLISRQEIIDQMMKDALPARFQAQLHKIIWPADAKGV